MIQAGRIVRRYARDRAESNLVLAGQVRTFLGEPMAIIPFLDIDGAALVYQLAGDVPVASIDLCHRPPVSILGDRTDDDAARDQLCQRRFAGGTITRRACAVFRATMQFWRIHAQQADPPKLGTTDRVAVDRCAYDRRLVDREEERENHWTV